MEPLLYQSPHEKNIQRLPELFNELEAFDDCILRNRKGEDVKIENIRKNYTCIFVFIGHFLDYQTKEYIEDFAKIFPRDLEEYKVKLIVVGCAPSRFIQPFCEETNFSHEMYCDSKRLVFESLTLHTYPESSSGGSSPHIKSNAFTAFFMTLWRLAKSSVEQGDPLQQGGQLVIHKDGKVLFFHRNSHPTDHTPINDLLKVAGLPRIDFNFKYSPV